VEVDCGSTADVKHIQVDSERLRRFLYELERALERLQLHVPVTAIVTMKIAVFLSRSDHSYVADV